MDKHIEKLIQVQQDLIKKLDQENKELNEMYKSCINDFKEQKLDFEKVINNLRDRVKELEVLPKQEIHNHYIYNYPQETKQYQQFPTWWNTPIYCDTPNLGVYSTTDLTKDPNFKITCNTIEYPNGICSSYTNTNIELGKY